MNKSNSSDIQVVTEWLLSHEEEVVDEAPNSAPSQQTIETEQDIPSEATGSQEEPQAAKSIKCDDCGKLFKNQTEVEFHAAKSGWYY